MGRDRNRGRPRGETLRRPPVGRMARIWRRLPLCMDPIDELLMVLTYPDACAAEAQAAGTTGPGRRDPGEKGAFL